MSAPTRSPLPSRRRRGGVVIIVALVLGVLLGFLALVIDLGYARVVSTQIQMNAEAAAMAGGMKLDGTDEGLENAVAAAMTYAELNPVAGKTVSIDAADVQTGVWDGADFTASTDAAEVNALRVTPRVDDVSAFFSKVAFGGDDMTMTGQATTTREFGGAGGVSCYLPVAIPSCLLESRYSTSSIVNVDLKLAPSGIDSMGWARVGGSPNASWTRSQILNCEADGEAAIGDDVGLQNGVVTSALSALATAVSSSSTTWDTSLWGPMPAQASNSSITASKYGNTFEGPIVVFEDDSYCTGSGGSFNGTEVISGFVWGAVYDVVNKGAASGKTIKMRLDTQNTYSDDSTRGGGPDYGITYAGSPTFVN